MLSTYSTSNTRNSRRTIKQGFVFKRGGSGFLAHWRLKFLVLQISNPPSGAAGTNINNGNRAPGVVTSGNGNGMTLGGGGSAPFRAILQVFDKRDQVSSPKHEIRLEDATVSLLSDETSAAGLLIPASGQSGRQAAGGLAGRGGVVKRNAPQFPFVVATRQRKFLFSAQTKSDRDEWIAALQEHTSASGFKSTMIPRQLNLPGGTLRHPPPNISSNTNPNRYSTLPRGGGGHNRYATYNGGGGFGARRFDDDAMSTFSDDSCITTASSAYATVGAHQMADLDDIQSVTSAVETLVMK
ncbi:hypothetical protein HK102_008473 [Quaeritorhiza haematococci]|nr:hypothetical protein HK102_008473 [Quaeritorhiza haematococci]